MLIITPRITKVSSFVFYIPAEDALVYCKCSCDGVGRVMILNQIENGTYTSLSDSDTVPSQTLASSGSCRGTNLKSRTRDAGKKGPDDFYFFYFSVGKESL